jgi:hypothetical protein
MNVGNDIWEYDILDHIHCRFMLSLKWLRSELTPKCKPLVDAYVRGDMPYGVLISAVRQIVWAWMLSSDLDFIALNEKLLGYGYQV